MTTDRIRPGVYDAISAWGGCPVFAGPDPDAGDPTPVPLPPPEAPTCDRCGGSRVVAAVLYSRDRRVPTGRSLGCPVCDLDRYPHLRLPPRR